MKYILTKTISHKRPSAKQQRSSLTFLHTRNRIYIGCGPWELIPEETDLSERRRDVGGAMLPYGAELGRASLDKDGALTDRLALDGSFSRAI
jgi:hypothetical protein